MLADETPAGFVAFDLLALGDESFIDRPLAERRAALVEALGHLDGSGPCFLTRTTDGPRRGGAVVRGVRGRRARRRRRQAARVAPYEPNKRTMLKIKHERTADVVLAGYREHKTSTPEEPLLGSLLLGPVRRRRRAAAHRRLGELHRRAPRRAAGTSSSRWSATSPTTPGAAWNEFLTANPDRVPGTQSRWSAGKDLGVHRRCAPSGCWR